MNLPLSHGSFTRTTGRAYTYCERRKNHPPVGAIQLSRADINRPIKLARRASATGNYFPVHRYRKVRAHFANQSPDHWSPLIELEQGSNCSIASKRAPAREHVYIHRPSSLLDKNTTDQLSTVFAGGTRVSWYANARRTSHGKILCH